MDRTLVDIALVLNAHPLASRLQIFGDARIRPDEAEVLQLGLVANPHEIDTPAFLSLRQLLLTTARRSGRVLKPLVLLDKPDGALLAPKGSDDLWEKVPASLLSRELRGGEPFSAWMDRVISPRMTDEGFARDPCVSALRLRSLRAAIVQHLDPSWLEPAYQSRWSVDNPTLGFCSMASEAAFFELGGGPAGWKAMVQREADQTTHWWLEHASGLRFDPTDSQYRQENQVPPYERHLAGRACAFMGMRKDPDSRWGFERKPGLRAGVLLDRLRPLGATFGGPPSSRAVTARRAPRH